VLSRLGQETLFKHGLCPMDRVSAPCPFLRGSPGGSRTGKNGGRLVTRGRIADEHALVTAAAMCKILLSDNRPGAHTHAATLKETAHVATQASR